MTEVIKFNGVMITFLAIQVGINSWSCTFFFPFYIYTLRLLEFFPLV